MEILIAFADGLTRTEAAARLGVAAGTVDDRRRHLMNKLGARTTIHALALAYARGLIAPSTESAVPPTSVSTPEANGSKIGP